jgi:tetratricopeptide (TPR) repeat protein
MSAEIRPTDQQEQFAEENRRAEELISGGDLPGAAAILVDIIDNDPVNARAYNNMGIISWTRKAWRDAFAMFKRSVELKPDYADALVNLFDAALKIRCAREILPLLKKAVETDPSLEDVAIIAESIETQSDEDVYSSERALMIGIANPTIEEADQLLEDGKVNEAMIKYLEVNDTEGPCAESYNGLGIVSYYQGRYSDAYALFLESIKLNPVDPDKWLNLLDTARQLEKVDEVRKIFELYAKEIQALKQIVPDFEKAAG